MMWWGMHWNPCSDAEKTKIRVIFDKLVSANWTLVLLKTWSESERIALFASKDKWPYPPQATA